MDNGELTIDNGHWTIDNGELTITGRHRASYISPFPFRRVRGGVVPGRVELPTSTLSVWRSNQLSYRTGFKLSDTKQGRPSLINSLYDKQNK